VKWCRCSELRGSPLDRLFVYGSLKAGGCAHHLLSGADQEPDGHIDGVELIERSGYPMLKPGSGQVSGEVYRVPPGLWPAIDAWEEAPKIYRRRSRTLMDGRSVWVYERP
jgi:gamma-glutamylcyclotransferase (GGCT)/AIG2-like uncharacterized protein YtfP